MPVAVTLRNALFPCEMVDPCGCAVICGFVHCNGLTVTVTALLLTDVEHAVTRTQYVVVVVGLTLIVDVVPPETGLLVVGGLPTNHWNVGLVPVAVTPSASTINTTPSCRRWACSQELATSGQR